VVAAVDRAKNTDDGETYLRDIAAGLRCGGCGTTDGPLAGADESLCSPCRATAA
jgi:hypothetical protein